MNGVTVPRGRCMEGPGTAQGGVARAASDREGRVAGVLAHAGRVPVFVAGNVRSGGDIAQLACPQASPYPSSQLLLNHDDGGREFAYDEADGASLAAAESGRWHVVSTRNHRERMFAGPVQ